MCTCECLVCLSVLTTAVVRCSYLVAWHRHGLESHGDDMECEKWEEGEEKGGCCLLTAMHVCECVVSE